jgi:arylsulfatase A-like enzyme
MMGSHGIRPKEKQLAWDESVKVPFLIRYPGIGKNEGAEVFSPVTTPDILPTMLALADIDIPASIEGEDISSMIRNPQKPNDRAVLFMSVSPFASTRFTEYRGIKNTRYTYVKTPGEPMMLFDQIEDPYQLNNLVGKPEYSEVQKKMDKLLTKKLKKIGDADFKNSQYYLDKWGYPLNVRQPVPYNTTVGKEVRVYTPEKRFD